MKQLKLIKYMVPHTGCDQCMQCEEDNIVIIAAEDVNKFIDLYIIEYPWMNKREFQTTTVPYWEEGDALPLYL